MTVSDKIMAKAQTKFRSEKRGLDKEFYTTIYGVLHVVTYDLKTQIMLDDVVAQGCDAQLFVVKNQSLFKA